MTDEKMSTLSKVSIAFNIILALSLITLNFNSIIAIWDKPKLEVRLIPEPYGSYKLQTINNGGVTAKGVSYTGSQKELFSAYENEFSGHISDILPHSDQTIDFQEAFYREFISDDCWNTSYTNERNETFESCRKNKTVGKPWNSLGYVAVSCSNCERPRAWVFMTFSTTDIYCRDDSGFYPHLVEIKYPEEKYTFFTHGDEYLNYCREATRKKYGKATMERLFNGT
jgi:hypothetical protein